MASEATSSVAALIDRVAHDGARRTVEAGEWVVRRRGFDQALFLLDGQVEIYRAQPSLRDRLIGFMSAPGLVGDPSLFLAGRGTTAVFAASRCELLTISAAELDRLLAAGGELAVRLFREAVQLHARVGSILEHWSSAETHERLLGLFFAELQPSSSGAEVGWAPLVRTRVARLLGVDRTTVARNLARLEDEGHIEERATSVLVLRDRRVRDLGPRARCSSGSSYCLSATPRTRGTARTD